MTTSIQLFHAINEVPPLYRLEVTYEFEAGTAEENLIPDGTGEVPTEPNVNGIYAIDLNLREGTEEELDSAILVHDIDMGPIQMEEGVHEIHIQFVTPNGVIGNGSIKAEAAQQETRPIEDLNN